MNTNPQPHLELAKLIASILTFQGTTIKCMHKALGTKRFLYFFSGLGNIDALAAGWLACTTHKTYYEILDGLYGEDMHKIGEEFEKVAADKTRCEMHHELAKVMANAYKMAYNMESKPVMKDIREVFKSFSND